MSGRDEANVGDCWRLEGTRAQLACGELSAAVDLSAPSSGLGQLLYQGQSFAGSLLGVTAHEGRTSDVKDWAADDAYVRGCDLVATYRESAERPFSLQIYWRVGDEPGRGGVTLETIVSVQTRRWEAFPTVTVRSALAALDVEIVNEAEPSVLVRPEGCAWSYAEASLPGDFVLRGVERGDDGLQRTAWEFGREFMERGVIRRLRLRGAFVPRADDIAAVRQMQGELAAEQPPLTA